MTKWLFLTGLLTVPMSAPAPKPTYAQRSNAEAFRILDAAVTAYGGAAGLEAARRFRVIQSGLRYQLFQNDDPEQPWDGWKLLRSAEADLDAGKFYGEYRVAKPATNYVWWTHEYVDGHTGWELILTKKWAVPMLEPGIEAMRDFIRLLPQSLLIEALGAGPSLRAMGNESADGRAQDIVEFTAASGQRLALFFDRDTHLLARYESLYTRNTVGDTVNEIRFLDYRASMGTGAGFPVPGRFVQYNAGYLATDARYDVVELGRPPDPSLFVVPADFAKLRIYDAKPELLRLAPGVYLVHGLQGGFNTMFVVFEDFLVAVEAPEENVFAGVSEKAIAMIQQAVPGKPIRYLVETHHHGDHSSGARAYIAEGATIITTAGNEAYLRRVAAAPYRMKPDALAKNPKQVKIEVLSDKKRVIGDGQRTIELYEVGPLHTREMVLAYLPKEKILFQSDLFNPISVNGPDPIEHDAPFHGVYDDNPARLYRQIRQLGLDVRTIAGSHGRVASMQELMTNK
jgi:glyoxylase-like metal-dependent hydrolase (beta-lactamase superfamily II)